MPLISYLSLSAILFCIGLYGVLTKRNAVIVLFSIELLLNAVNINSIAFAKLGPWQDSSNEIFALFNMAIGAAEVSVGLAIIIALYRNRSIIDVEKYNTLKG